MFRMKKLTKLLSIIIITAFCLSLVSCSAGGNAKIKKMEDLINHDKIASVDSLRLKENVDNVVAYRVGYNTGVYNMVADFILPSDYRSNVYPVVFYFPEVGCNTETLAKTYASEKIIIVRIHARGYGVSPGNPDLGGKEVTDAKILLEICRSVDFLKDSKFFAAGSSMGSVTALCLAGSEENLIDGCAVVDVVSDIKSYVDYRGESVEQLMSALIGKTYEESPEEYEKRSAINFCDKIKCPVLIITYPPTAELFPTEQAEGLHKLLEENGIDSTYKEIDERASDFMGQGLNTLIRWIIMKSIG